MKSERARMQQIDAFFLRVARFVLIAYAFFVFFVWLSERALWRITDIEVEGAHAVSRDEIVSMAWSGAHERHLFLIRRDNRLLYPEHDLLSDLHARYPRIERVTAEFPSAHRLVIRVVEYTPAYLYCRVDDEWLDEVSTLEPTVVPETTASTTDQSVDPIPALPREPIPSDCYFADRHGYVFAQAPQYIGRPFLTILSATSTTLTALSSPIGSMLFASGAQSKIERFVFELDGLAIHTHTVVLRSDGDVEFKTNLPWTILWSITADPAESTRNLGVVLSSINAGGQAEDELHRIDLRFGNKVFYQ